MPRQLRLPPWDRHGYLFAIICVALATLLFMPGRETFAKGQWALLYLLIIVFVAGIGGFRASLLASVLAFLTWNFLFLPPYNTLWVHDPKDWLSLIVFLVVGITMGLQASRMRNREQVAVARERETALLNRLSASLVSIASTATMAETLLAETRTITGARSAALYLTDTSGHLQRAFHDPVADDSEATLVDRMAAWVHRQDKAIGLPFVARLADLGVEGWPISVRHEEVIAEGGRHDILLPLQTSTQVEGVLYCGERMDDLAFTPHDVRMLVSIGNLAAVFLERQRLGTEAGRSEALREADRLKSALVSSVSHELKTPLAAIKATVSNLLEEDVLVPPEDVRAELSAVSADVDRLSDSITGLLDLSRLQADAWESHRDWYEFGEIVADAVASLAAATRGRIHYEIPDDLLPMLVDFQQWSRALQHLMENALAYSPPNSPVRVGASQDPHGFRLWVEDSGRGVPPAERERIFERFYRGSAASLAPSGTGLGLAITAEIVRYHGGRIWIEEAEPHGSRFVIALPCGRQG